MPQLDYFSYWHQLVVAFSAFTYIFFVISFFFAPAIFLRPRLLFLLQLYATQYVQFMMFFTVKFFDLQIFNFLNFEDLVSFFSKGFTSVYLFYKQNKFVFFGFYFNSFCNYKLILNEKLSWLNFFSHFSSEITDEYSQESFLLNLLSLNFI